MRRRVDFFSTSGIAIVLPATAFAAAVRSTVAVAVRSTVAVAVLSAVAVAVLPAVTVADTAEPPRLDGVGFEVAFEHLEFKRPLWVGHPGDGSDRLFVVEQDGRIYQFENDPDVRNADLALDLRERVHRGHNEEGLLGFAFHPQIADNGTVFLHYSAKDPRRGVISRFTMDADRRRILPETEKVILELEQPWGNHNGGCLAFGPDGYLYIAFGDGGRGGDPLDSGQDTTTLLGTILRIDVDTEGTEVTDGTRVARGAYSIPWDNPLADDPAARAEIWAFGLRNVWRFSFDRQTGDLWAGDVGQSRFEEIDLIVRGGNYGWKLREGSHPYKKGELRPEFIDPVVDYDRNLARSITGGYVYRGQEISALQGGYVHGDYVTGLLWVLWWDGSKVTRHHSLGRADSVSSFGEDRDGELYFTSFDGRIYHFVDQRADSDR